MNKMAKLNYPWLSAITGILTAAYLYTASSSEMSSFYPLPAELFESPYRFLSLFVFAAAIFFDSYRFHQRRQSFDQQVQRYEQQIKELLQGKNKLQHKVRKYSDHADKLKLFISDRLLEHIEYDEKFLHFRNIAAEVRHNGVICYDKVVSSLQQATQTADHTDAKPDIKQYREALDSMAYLWVLLDLSTTDNIAMYIANKLYEYEEQYYQQLLASDGEASPYSPTFPARNAIRKAVRGFIDTDGLVMPNESGDDSAWYHSDDRFRIELHATGELLGDENYLVLLTENLINNALFYSSKKRQKNPHARVAIRLIDDGDRIRLSIYNRGPEIPDEMQDKIFQLGYSTKRAREISGSLREHTGKGLGLYFVNEIAKGYESTIQVENIRNREDAYVIRIEFSNGEKLTEIIHTTLDENQLPRCRPPEENPESEKTLSSMEYRFTETITSIEITSQATQKTWSVESPGNGSPITFLDPQNPDHPCWSLEITPLKTRQKLVFKPLDISGVQFTVSIPSAKSRLDPDYHDMDDDELDDTENLDRKFEDVSQYVS